jgi:hypothetical protein
VSFAPLAPNIKGKLEAAKVKVDLVLACALVLPDNENALVELACTFPQRMLPDVFVYGTLKDEIIAC